MHSGCCWELFAARGFQSTAERVSGRYSVRLGTNVTSMWKMPTTWCHGFLAIGYIYIYIYLEGHSYECSGFDGISLWEDWCSLLIVFQYMTWYYIEASMCLYAEKSFLTYIVYIVWLFKHVSSTDAMWTLTWWAKINIFSPWMTLYRFTTANRFNHYNSCLQKNFNKPTLNMSQFLVSPMLGWVPWHLGLCINFMPLTVDGKYPAPIRGYTNM